MASDDHELHTLAAAYVMDAVADHERTRFSTHLSDCAQCREDVREMRETTARLGAAVAVRPRPELRARAIQAASLTSQLAPVISEGGQAGERPADLPATAGRDATGLAAPPAWRRLTGRPALSPPRSALARLAVAAVVIVAAAAAGLGFAANHMMQQLHHSQRQDHLIVTVLNAPDAVMLTAKVSTGGTATVVMSHREHTLVFTAHGLLALPDSEGYELWLMGPSGDKPAGMLKQQQGGMAGPAVVSGLAAGDMVGLTVEPVGGSPQPTSAPVVLIGQGSR